MAFKKMFLKPQGTYKNKKMLAELIMGELSEHDSFRN